MSKPDTLENGSPLNTLHKPVTSASRNISSVNLSPPEVYAHKVFTYSKLEAHDSYFSGAHCSRLGKFLFSPYQTYGGGSSEIISSKGLTFVTVCNLGMAREDSERTKHFKEPEDFAKYFEKCQRETTGSLENTSGSSFLRVDSLPRQDLLGRMIFLRGVPSPQWLNQLGASLDIDPEFFYRHIEVSPAFLPQSDSLHQSYLPPSPTTRNIFELRICNTGSWEPNHSRIALSELRRSSHDSMHQNLENFINWRHVSLGDSIVRRFSVHDLYCFTIEQKITVEVIFHTQQWAAIVWLDAGNDLGVSSVGPWLEGSASATHSIRLHPIYQHRDRIALSSYVHTQANNEGSQTDQNGTLKLPQTVNHLHNNYGRLLKSDVMEKDAFYALNELFHFSAASVDQYLALLEDKVGRITIDQPVSGLSELLMAKAIVDDYRRSVRETLHIVRCRGASNWPRVKEERWAQKAERSAKELESRYERLLQRCEDLSEQCGSGITLLADNRAKDQSQQAIEQTDKVAKLTFLAYIFVPLSFTASFFGMNFKELGQHLSLYTFFITSSTVLFISLVVMYCDLKKCFEKLWHALAHLWRLDIVRRSTTRQTDKLFEA